MDAQLCDGLKEVRSRLTEELHGKSSHVQREEITRNRVLGKDKEPQRK